MPLTVHRSPREARGRCGEGLGLGGGWMARLRACSGAGGPRPPHPSPRRCEAPFGGRKSGSCGPTACGSAALLRQRWKSRLAGQAARAPRSSPRATRHRPGGPGAACLAAAPCAGSADAEHGGRRDPPRVAAAAPSLCIPGLVRCGVFLRG